VVFRSWPGDPILRSSTVESDIVIIKYEKDPYRSGLADLSLEGMLHAKQRSQLFEVRAYVNDYLLSDDSSRRIDAR
jgi:hypothetical protein